ncbi:MAG: hypothetical protein LQ342_004156 [Letrouitia transgressa]|nr:MAG: hypothetical protein LQ342_004156 [Letrouitia transgressa]
MIERAAPCLEKGGRCLLRSPKKPFRSYRSLHSAFWSHGAGNIELPSWWIAFLQVPAIEEQSYHLKRTDMPNDTPLFENHHFPLLDFLYPTQTLAYIRQYLHRNATALQRYRAPQLNLPSPRTFTSTAESSACSFAEVSQQISNENRDLEVLEAGNTTPSFTFEAGQDVRTEFNNVLRSQTSSEQTRHLWRLYERMQELALPLQPEERDQLFQRLNSSSHNLEPVRTRLLFDTVPVAMRQARHYFYGISAALKMHNLDKAFAMHHEASATMQESYGTALMLRYTIQHQKWIVAIDVWRDYWANKRSHPDPNLWQEIDKMPLSILMEKVSDFIDYAMLTAQNTVSSCDVPERDMAVALVQHALSIQAREYELSIQARMLRKFMGLGQPVSGAWRAAIIQNFSLGAKAISHSRFALRLYRRIRFRFPDTLDSDLLLQVLNQLWLIRSSAGLYQVMEDYRKHLGGPTKQAYRLLIRGFSYQGNLDTVKTLFDESIGQFNPREQTEIADYVLFACSKRGSILELDDTLRMLQDKIGYRSTQYTKNIVLATHARVGDSDSTMDLFEKMKADSWTYMTVMGMFAKRGDLGMVMNLYQQSISAGVKTSCGMINCLVLAQLRDGRVDEAHQLIEEALDMDLEIPRAVPQYFGAKESRTQMWNYLLLHYASRGDLTKVGEIPRRMEAVGVALDNMTYAAIMQGLCVRRLPFDASRILTKVMPKAGMRATSFHYIILMSGFFQTKCYRQVLRLSQRMRDKNVKPTFGTRNLALKAAAATNFTKRPATSNEGEPTNLAPAEAVLDDALKTMNPNEVALPQPNPYSGNMAPLEAFTSSYFSTLIAFYGEHKLFDKIAEMFDKLIVTTRQFQQDIEASPPLELLSALMGSHNAAGNHKEVERCWFLAFNKASVLARRHEADISGENWVLYARRMILCQPLKHYLHSLEATGRANDARDVIRTLLHAGFGMTNQNWNIYVQMLVRNGCEVEAFEVCERELISGWLGWEILGHKDTYQLKKRFFKANRRYYQNTRRMPIYETLVYLAGAYMDAQATGFESGRTMVRSMARVAPKTLDAVLKLPKLEDDVQTRILRLDRT